MADSKISALTTETAADPNDLLVIAEAQGTFPETYASKKALRKNIIGIETLFANRTYYVRADGNDANDGLTNTSGGAFLTIQAAVDAAFGVNWNGYAVTISIGNGTYTAGAVVTGFAVGQKSPDDFIIKGGSGTASDVTISVTSDNCFQSDYGAMVTVQDLTVQTTTSGIGLYATNRGVLQFSNIAFGACPSNHVTTAGEGALIVATGNYSITGNAPIHMVAYLGSQIVVGSGITITLTGTPAFSSYFAGVYGLSILNAAGNTYSGSATGKRYNSTGNGLIHVAGAGSTYFPGNVAGTTASGGLYI